MRTPLKSPVEEERSKCWASWLNASLTWIPAGVHQLHFDVASAGTPGRRPLSNPFQVGEHSCSFSSPLARLRRCRRAKLNTFELPGGVGLNTRASEQVKLVAGALGFAPLGTDSTSRHRHLSRSGLE